MNDPEKALKEIEEAMRKLQIPTISFEGSAFKAEINNTTLRDELIFKLREVSGMSLSEVVDKFAAGWTLQPPSYVMGFDTEELMESMRKEVEDEIRRAGYFNAGERVIPPLQISFEQLNNPPKESIEDRYKFFEECDKLDVEEKDGVAIIEMEEPSNKKYKIEIWVYGRVEETYEHDDIEEVLRWYRIRWKHMYDCGGCCFDIYENDRILKFKEELALGFYE